MKTLRLGLVLAVRGDRAARVRFLLMAFGCAIGVACLAAVLCIPTIVAAHDARGALRDFVTARGTEAEHSDGLPLTMELSDPFGSRPVTRVFVARPGTGGGPTPPGVRRLPGPGEVLVSPALRSLLAEAPGLKGALPGRITGTIGQAGLMGPDELYAYVGRTPQQLAHTSSDKVLRYGGRSAPYPTLDGQTLDILRFTLCCLVLLPLFVYLSVCVRLSAESRSRRLAALRLLGLSARDTVRVSAVETVCAASLGAVMGLGLYLVGNAVVAETGWVGLAWYPADGLPSTSTLVACLLGCPVLAYVAGRRHAREAALRPLSVRRRERERRPRAWLAALLVLPGLGIVTAYCVLGLVDKVPGPSTTTSFLVPAGALLTGAGLILALPPATAWAARRVAERTQRVSLTLAMRHHEAHPGTALRVVSGLVLLVYAASLTQGVLIEMDQVSRRDAPNQEYSVPYERLSADQLRQAKSVPGVNGQALAGDLTDSPGGVFVGTCAQLEAFVIPGSMKGCVDGEILAIHDPVVPREPTELAGTRHTLRLRDGAGGPAGEKQLTIPRRTITVSVAQPSAVVDALVVVPPSALPAGTHPAGTDLLLSSATDQDTVRAVLDGLAAIAPTTEITPVGIVIESLNQLAVIKGLLATGMVLGLGIGVAAFLVSTADHAMSRRTRTAALTLLGIRPGTLRAAQSAQVVLPLALGLVAAVITGKLAESSYLVTGGGAIFWDTAGVPLLLVSTLAVVVVAGLACLPMARRHLDPEALRKD
ncbi:ABC transporter permease [Streptomyces sp. SID11385]|uniref:ABC transporter permease n=1 Tax=Streptomyces sp. SID11385 TaxID=2706031 RepID=UPI0013C99486|nr:ABC transporter permease [Streptomyces sp. SID11385]